MTLRAVLLAGCAGVAFFLVSTLGVVIALTGAGVGCIADSAAPSVGGKVGEIPADRLRLYRAAGRRFDLDWAFLASIGAQECHHGSCAGDNGSGCAGPMQIAVRRGSPCSPGGGPDLWDSYGVDGDDDGDTDPDSPADAIFTAARVLREAKHAPPAGGSFAAYRTAACGYYGACGDATADYADEVMTRAVAYGFGKDRTTAAGCGGAAVVARRRAARHRSPRPRTGRTGATARRRDGRRADQVRSSHPRRRRLARAPVPRPRYGVLRDPQDGWGAPARRGGRSRARVWRELVGDGRVSRMPRGGSARAQRPASRPIAPGLRSASSGTTGSPATATPTTAAVRTTRIFTCRG